MKICLLSVIGYEHGCVRDIYVSLDLFSLKETPYTEGFMSSSFVYDVTFSPD